MTLNWKPVNPNQPSTKTHWFDLTFYLFCCLMFIAMAILLICSAG